MSLRKRRKESTIHGKVLSRSFGEIFKIEKQAGTFRPDPSFATFGQSMNDQVVLDSEHPASSRYGEAIAYLEQRINYENFQNLPYQELAGRLERLRELLVYLGSPEKRYLTVHVAGTKGKGSTCTMLKSILQQAGYRVGVFSSPHLYSPLERFTVDGVPCDAGEFGELMLSLRDRIGHWETTCQFPWDFTYFELTTLFAFEYFLRKQVDIAILEVGLGGRLDATNVCSPTVSVITNISFDHMEQLGPTLEMIAEEKAGIIKPGVPLVAAPEDQQARHVIKRKADALGTPSFFFDEDFTILRRNRENAASFCFTPLVSFSGSSALAAVDSLRLKLLGEHQEKNAALAISTALLLKDRLNIAHDDIRNGLAKAFLPIRVEMFRPFPDSPTMVIDGAHNRASVRALVQALEKIGPFRRKTLFFGTSLGKDIEGMLSEILPYFDRIILTQHSSSPRRFPPRALRTILHSFTEDPGGSETSWGSIEISEQENASTALKSIWTTSEQDDLLCVSGSMYLAGELREFFLRELAASGTEKIDNSPEGASENSENELRPVVAALKNREIFSVPETPGGVFRGSPEMILRTLTLGCKVNQYETEFVRQGLLHLGWRDATDDEPATLVVVNTCTVTAESDLKSRKAVRKLIKENPGAEVVVMGCSATRNPKPIAEISGVSQIITDKQAIPEFLQRKGLNEIPTGLKSFGERHRAFVKVQDGCRVGCSYCIIPKVRPVLRSRPVADVLDEIRTLSRNGYREIVLTGIHLGHYGVDFSRRENLASLVRQIVELKEDFRLRISSLEAVEVSDELVDIMVANPRRICPHLHLSMQSGSDTVLRRMKRRWLSEPFVRRCEEISARFDRLALTTDVIVGFPDETEEEFAETLRVVERLKFSKVHVFRFSPREGTEAEKLPNRVPLSTQRRRAGELDRLADRLRRNYAESLVGMDLSVMLETPFGGTADRYLEVRLAEPVAEERLGSLLNVRIDRADGDLLRQVSEPDASARECTPNTR